MFVPVFQAVGVSLPAVEVAAEAVPAAGVAEAVPGVGNGAAAGEPPRRWAQVAMAPPPRPSISHRQRKHMPTTTQPDTPNTLQPVETTQALTATTLADMATTGRRTLWGTGAATATTLADMVTSRARGTELLTALDGGPAGDSSGG